MKFLSSKPAEADKTFDAYVGVVAKQALLGPTAANRLIAFGEELLSVSTLDDLALIADGTRPPNVPKNNKHLEDTTPALLRTIHDFEVGDRIRYHTAEQATRWSEGIVNLGHVTLINMSKGNVCATDDNSEEGDNSNDGVSDARGLIIVNHFGDNGVYFAPNWPALMSEDLNEAVQNRRRGLHQQASWRKFARALVGLSYFDEHATNPVFQTAIKVTLRHLDARTPTQPPPKLRSLQRKSPLKSA